MTYGQVALFQVWEIPPVKSHKLSELETNFHWALLKPLLIICT